MMKKQQPWMFSMIINSSYSSSTMGRQFCSSTTTTTNTNTSCCLSSSSSVSHEPPTPQQKKQQQFNILLEKKLSLLSSSSSVSNKTLQQQKKQQQQLNILLEKKLPLLIVPYDYFTPHRYALSRETRDRYHFVCDGNLGFINVFHDDDDDDDQLIINKKKKKVEVCHMYFPELFRRKICGSSEGWLFTISGIGEFRLFNPVTRVVVDLPDFKAFPGLRPMLPLYKKNFRDSFIYKAVTNTTTNSTTAATTVVVMAICEYHRGLVFCKTSFSSSSSSSIGNGNGSSTTDHILEPAAWIKIPLKTPMSAGLLTKSLKTPMSAGLPTKSELHDLGRSSITRHILEDITYEVIDGVTYWVSLKLSWWVDVLFYQGNFYAVSSEGVVGVVKGLDGPSPFVQFLLDASDETRDYSLIHHLVESSSSSSSSSSSGGGGDLLMVLREMERQYPTIEFEVDQHIPYRTIGFRVLKLDLNGGGGPSWEEVTDLGEDCALFVGYNHSFSFSASKIPGCRGNCIYFTDYHRLTIQYFPNGGHDIGVYNLEDGSVEKLNYATCNFQLYLPPPVWYAPN